mmetsp:Transcript_62951/g.149984  ORF Transcript_62951/g.149984 Transcript_62951/m.149984 type:complete len:399 (-) Transcript_62951:136-1332(-)
MASNSKELATPLLTVESSVDDLPAVWAAFFVVLPVYSSYAALFGLQHVVKQSLNIPDNESAESQRFCLSVALVYVCNLLSRFLHRFALAEFCIRSRVLLAMSAMVCSMLVLVSVMVLQLRSMSWIALAYMLGGISIGAFDPNFLSSITPLGPKTKRVAISGIPFGISSLLIGAFFLMGPPVDLLPAVVYGALAFSVFLGMLTFSLRIPAGGEFTKEGESLNDDVGLDKLMYDLRSFRSWLPGVLSPTIVFACNMFAVTGFAPGVALYIYDEPTLVVMPGLEVATDSFFAVFNLCSMLGSLTGRSLSYTLVPRNPAVYLALTLFGIWLLLRSVPLLVLCSAYLIMLGDGLIYGSISRHIDSQVSREFNLSAISFWCLFGDIGASIGALLINNIRDWIVG